MRMLACGFLVSQAAGRQLAPACFRFLASSHLACMRLLKRPGPFPLPVSKDCPGLTPCYHPAFAPGGVARATGAP